MNANPCRRFSLLDAMILVAAVAIGLAWSSARSAPNYTKLALDVIVDGDYVDGVYAEEVMNSAIPAWTKPIRGARVSIERTIPFLTLGTLSLLALRLRPPRPPFRLLFRQPGFIAGFTVLVLLAANAAFATLQLLICSVGRSYLRDPKFFANVAYVSRLVVRPEPIGQAVFASWLILSLSGRWRRKPGWIDLSGVILGALWIAMLLAVWIGERLT